MRRESLWLFIGASRTVLAAPSTAVFTNAMNAASLALRPFTVVRTVGQLNFLSDQSGAAENYDAAMGMCVVSSQAAAIGVTAIPTPFTDLGSDLWFVHQMGASRFEFVSGVGFHPANGLNRQYESRAMRKVNDDSEFVVVVETSPISAGAVVWHAARVLIKLH